MKTKVTISLWTWVFLACAIAAGYTMEASLAMLALLGHELAHIIVTLSQGKKISSLTIYPFGGVVKGTDPLALFSFEEVITAFAGPAWNFFCTAVGWLLAMKLNIWQAEIKLWWQINLWMGLVNLLPLFPLDGGRILAFIFLKFWGYRKGIAIVSYSTQIVAVFGAGYWLIYRPSISEIHYLLIAIVIFVAAMKERQAAPFVLFRYLLKKNNQFNLKSFMPARLYAVQEEAYLGDIVQEMKEDCYYIFCGIDKTGKKRFISEKVVVETLIEKGVKVRLQDILEKDFIA